MRVFKKTLEGTHIIEDFPDGSRKFIPDDMDDSNRRGMQELFDAGEAELLPADPVPEKSWVEIRGERDRRLSASDWMAVSDRTITDAQTAYRQALRDVPQDFSDASSVVWPT